MLPAIIHAYGTRYVHAVKPCCDCLEGGDGEYLTPTDVDPHELELGIHEELEHTTDLGTAQRLALDHLANDPHYYSQRQAARPARSS
jgi:hypothetical protein